MRGGGIWFCRHAFIIADVLFVCGLGLVLVRSQTSSFIDSFFCLYFIMSKKNKTPSMTAAKKAVAKLAVAKQGRIKTPSRKKKENAAAVASVIEKDDNEKDGDDVIVKDDDDETKVGRAAVLDQEVGAESGTDSQSVVDQLRVLLSKISPSLLVAVSPELATKQAPGSVAGSNFSDVSDSDGADTRSVLPARAVTDSTPSKRLRGGKDRLAGRQSSMRRTHGADMSDEDMDRVDRVLQTACKVPSFSRARARARGQRFGRPSSLVMDMLVDEGELPPSGDSDRKLASILEGLRAQSAKDARKKVKEYKTFGAWYARYSEIGVFSREILAEDEDTYWCFDWHLKCMLYIMGEFDWETASAYHARVIKRWDRLDHGAMAYGEDTACGDWETAVHTDSLYSVQLRSQSKSKTKGGDRGKSDWFCKPCGKHFPRSDNHASTCKKVSPTQAAAAAPGGGKAKP